MTIINLSDEIKKRTPHISGYASCVCCHHTWQAVVVIGTKVLECPECQQNKGVFCEIIYPDDGVIWECNCGCNFFFLTPIGELCPNCGTYQNR